MGKKFATTLAFLISIYGYTSVALSQESMAWSYGGETGPTHWGELSRDYAMCQQGMNQSPIDIVDTTFDRLFAIDFDYRPTPLQISKRNNTVEINYGTPTNEADHSITIAGEKFILPGNTNYNSRIIVSGEVYHLENIQFRAPSEHSVEHKGYPMEVQMIHRSQYNQLAIVAVFVDVETENPFIEYLWQRVLTESIAHKASDKTLINMKEILPNKNGYYHYRGSLTTPPCNEGVRWFVMKDHIHISQAQLDKFTTTFGINNRPQQPRNYRFLLESL